MRLAALLHPTHPLHLLLGLSVWFTWFCLFYGGVSLGCQIAPPPLQAGPWNWLNATAGVLSIVTIALLLWAAMRCWRHHQLLRSSMQPRRFITAVAAGLYLLAATATLAVTATLLLFPPCLQ